MIIPTLKASVIDKTTAGDTFNSALVKSLNEGNKLIEVITYSNTVLALSVAKLERQNYTPYTHKITALENP